MCGLSIWDFAFDIFHRCWSFLCFCCKLIIVTSCWFQLKRDWLINQSIDKITSTGMSQSGLLNWKHYSECVWELASRTHSYLLYKLQMEMNILNTSIRVITLWNSNRCLISSILKTGNKHIKGPLSSFINWGVLREALSLADRKHLQIKLVSLVAPWDGIAKNDKLCW